jgi:hypothetical protein
MLFFGDKSFKVALLCVLSWYFMPSLSWSYDNPIPTSFRSFRDYIFHTSYPDSVEKTIYSHQNNPQKYLHELIWLESHVI